jgi:hypothetical protein
LTRKATTDSEKNPEKKAAQAGTALADEPLATFRKELLEIAFQAGTAIPIEADLADRCRAQGAAAEAWLELHQPGQVLGRVEQIRDWRRGAAYADLAMYCARRGDAGDARKYLNLASKIAQTEEDWHRARIRVKVAQVHALLGQPEESKQALAGLDKVEMGKVVGAGASRGDPNSFDSQMKELTVLLATRDFDVGRNALESGARLFDDVYGDVKRRSAVEEKIKASWDKVPPFIRIELLTTMANSALGHKDQAKALALVDEAQAIVDSAKWAVEDYIPLQTRLACLRSRVGDKEKVASTLAAALASFEADRMKVLSTARAGTLLAIAEAQQETGFPAVALAVYKKALAEGVSNPNGRPRALDLSATCRSMALYAVEPDAELWGGIRKALGELGRPW